MRMTKSVRRILDEATPPEPETSRLEPWQAHLGIILLLEERDGPEGWEGDNPVLREIVTQVMAEHPDDLNRAIHRAWSIVDDMPDLVEELGGRVQGKNPVCI